MPLSQISILTKPFWFIVMNPSAAWTVPPCDVNFNALEKQVHDNLFHFITIRLDEHFFFFGLKRQSDIFLLGHRDK